MEVAHKVQYKVRELGTRSVTLFPTQAQIKREIKDVPLKPGTNEISILGFSPTIDKNSVMVEGSGSATITGISVEFVPNHELFDDVYPDDDSDDSLSDDDSDEFKEADEYPGLAEAFEREQELSDHLQKAREEILNADDRLKILDSYSKSVDKREGVIISEVLETYKQQRERAYEDRMAGTLRERTIIKALSKAESERLRLSKLKDKQHYKTFKAQNKVLKAKQKAKSKQLKRIEEKRKEKERIRNERARCWPKYCYTVHIQLEVNPSFTPSSSRRSSFSSEVDVVKRSESRTVPLEENPTCDLLLSYVTNSAFWTPSYDLQLSTVNATGTLCFDAGLHNTTSETWENCKITLSTSQATSSTLDDSIPILVPWHIKLASKGSAGNIFNSRQERQQKNEWQSKKIAAPAPKPRQEMFGLNTAPAENDYQTQLMMLEQQNKKRLMMARQEQDGPAAARWGSHQPQAQQMIQQQQMLQAQQQAQRQQMLNPQMTGAVQIMGPPLMPQQQMQMQTHGMMQQQRGQQTLEDFIMSEEVNRDDDDVTMPDTQPSLEFQNSLVEETGFTTTYDLPGLKTLVPKFTVSKQRVARLNFANVLFSHTVVAKYQPVAYLRAKLRNNSKLTLLRGPASLTLDGSFMGQAKIPRCNSGEIFSLSLGVDSAIRVMYPKPDVRRSTSGMFSKEDSSVYVRTVTVHNTRVTATKPAQVLVLDQVPVSEDDRLRVDISNPRGLTLGGAPQAAGLPGRETQEDKNWGKATATLKGGGQITWDVSLNPGKAVKLGLEYAVSMPSGDAAQEC
ncbi:Hypothetical protein NCS54_00804100 [Fusarium falciforme]|uniref:Hypothetical protein n=1 Tax=Fusarium falciforme TaxID=195108 RepID=UPI00230152D8|nr:Hypothetical protein NCS54_00804100 [Fusarium falciforme]WAO90607.1 Hypothetical protein NCS54_00804100 [Fusarium falciforme]